MRTGRVTAPVGPDSRSRPTEFPVKVEGIEGRASRPLRTRERRNSSSRETPGVLVKAPVAGGSTALVRAGLLFSPALEDSARGDLAGRPDNKGSAVMARLATASLALVGRESSLPSCFALTELTARS